jgi:PAS domain S-box-containing protein
MTSPSDHPQLLEGNKDGPRKQAAPFSSLRSRLSLIMVLALIPAAVFLILDAISINQKVQSEAEADIQRLSRLLAGTYGQRVDEAQRILAAIAQYPEVRVGDAAACSGRLAEMVGLYAPQYRGFGVSNLDGEMFCTSAPLTATVQIADRLWFREVVRTGEFAIGEYSIGRPSGLPILGLGYPVVSASGQVTRVVSHGLLLPVLQTEADEMPLPPDAVLTITDREGIILVRSQGEEWIGRRQADAVLAQMEAAGAGVVEATGVDGVERLYAFTPIRGPSGTEVWLSIGRSPQVVYAEVWQTLTRDIVGMLAILLAALAAVWLASNRLLLRRIDVLVGASNRLAAGDWEARAPVRPNGDELDDLGRAFNNMADALLQRRTRLLERERHLHLALQAARMMAWTWDPVQDRLETTENFPDIYGTGPAHTSADGFALVHPDDLARHQQVVTQAGIELRPYQSEFRIIRPDNGRVVWLDERAVPIVDDAGNMQRLAGVVMDITERKQAEEALQVAREQAVRSAERIARLQSVTAALSEAATSAQVVEVIVRQAAATLGAAAGVVHILDDNGEALEMVQAVGYPAGQMAKHRRLPLTLNIPATDAMRTGEPVWFESTAELLAHYPHLAGQRFTGYEGVALLPLLHESRPLGVVAFSFLQQRRFSGEERGFLLTIAHQCALALERTRLFDAEQRARATADAALQQVQRSAARIAQLQAVTASLAAALTPAEVIGIIISKGAAVLDAAATSVKLRTADGAWLESPQFFNYPDDITAVYQRYPLSSATPMADAARTGEAVWLSSARSTADRYPHLAEAVEALGLEAAAALPLMLGEQIIGAMGISFATERQFDVEEREYLLTLASQCAQALERARLYEAEQQARMELEERVAERTAELERSNRELNQFAYVASHDLKAPLRAIDALARWISEDAAGVLPPRSAEHLIKMRSRVKRMEKLLDDLLAYSRAGRVNHPPEPIDLHLLVQDIAGVLSPPPGFAVIVEPPVPELRTPRVSLELVLRNLIGNAIKHHHRPYGEICVRAVVRGRMVEFSVQDDGPGINPKYHDQIFEMFQTLQSRDKVEGSGMGLAIVKKLVESYGGTIAVESEVGKGTTFRFTWPCEVNGSGEAQAA